MSKPDYLTLVDHYESCLERHGDSHLGVDWPSAADAEARYRVMLEMIAPSVARPVTLLDFGCGAAHLADFLHARGRTDIHYTGLDASPKFVDVSRRKHPDLEFLCLDVLNPDAELPEFDYVVMNGVLTEKRGLSFEDMRQFMERILERVFRATRVGLAFNVMSKHVDWERDDLFHVPFDMLASFLRAKLSRHFEFRADYGLYEFTTYVFRDPR